MKSMQERVKPSPVKHNNLQSDDRLREVILYIAARCESHENFGAVKLNKILFFADYISYLSYGEPITGAQYQKLPNGPAPVYLVPIRKQMEAVGDIAIRQEAFFFKTQHRIIALRAPKLDMFKARDIALLEDVIDVCKTRSATHLSDMSHGLAWKVADEKEVIPYVAALLDNHGINAQDIEEAQQLIQEHGWQGV
ncbi:MAG: Panacea domain-containing protein [Pyrinomonadaceae bacterium]